ncbi:hypothetical protein Barb6XT_03061 [Bacteroidales bacterium Barb6XT]|nr:hypothetical protein Barb6XT_03061 [Bacteroidales bacterium Barb6XT]
MELHGIKSGAITGIHGTFIRYLPEGYFSGKSNAFLPGKVKGIFAEDLKQLFVIRLLYTAGKFNIIAAVIYSGSIVTASPAAIALPFPLQPAAYHCNAIPLAQH